MAEKGNAIPVSCLDMWRNVRFGSKADMCAAKRHVCFIPSSDIDFGMSALGHKQTHAVQQ